jgi:hypothetical protein
MQTEYEAAQGDPVKEKAVVDKFTKIITAIFPQRTDKPSGLMDKIVADTVEGRSGQPRREGFSVERSKQ